jgi:glycosyltransferase involved in cell wall biosynthesis
MVMPMAWSCVAGRSRTRDLFERRRLVMHGSSEAPRVPRSLGRGIGPSPHRVVVARSTARQWLATRVARAMNVLYVTSRFPHGPGEAFLGPEIAAHLEAGIELTVFPMLAKGEIVHSDARGLAERTACVTLGSSIAAAGRGVVAAPRALVRAASFAAGASSWAARRRNAAVAPRALALVDVVRRVQPDHLHVHWGGASSTLAMTAAESLGLPWSMTLHRWDIAANNLLEHKLRSACFTRVISESGAASVRELVPEAEVEVIHMGVTRGNAVAKPPAGPLRLVCVAGLVPVKNHAALLEAFRSARGGHDVSLDLVGSGPLGAEIAAQIARAGLAEDVRLLGPMSHGSLLAQLRSGRWGGMVLASTAHGGECEGIPVSLMEAMAAGIPVIATDSGGTRELIGGGAGLLVPVNDTAALAEGLRQFIADGDLRARLARLGHQRIAESFDAVPLAARLRERFAECGGGG